ncbi:unnamed protein product [Cuscuta epithymum]|uniref:DUF1985 domain-containing protein n=1 Tax=Cuscuta epithymum TaxID=186058 RepID=A0AAV0FH89_9ASTE|nr:unnamed protein product [Cuscuta epithymum]
MKINCYCNLSKVVERIKKQLKDDELIEFRRTIFGWVLDVEDMRTISGQLHLGFLCNYVKKVNDIKEVNAINFHIQNSMISFTKKDLCMVLGLKFGGEKPAIDENFRGELWRKYFGNTTWVKRSDCQNALLNYNTDDPGVEKNDGVKLALLHVLSNGLFGNQVARALPALYVNLVDNLEQFNEYPWGDDVWSELVANMRANPKSLKKCKGDRVTLPGCLIAIQVWAFETFTGLAKEGICSLIQGRETRIPRAVRWSFVKKPSMETLSNIIFKNEQV